MLHVAFHLMRRGALISLLLCPVSTVYAQCGGGIPSGGNPNCIPPDVYHSQGITQPQSTMPVQQPIVIRQKWADRWGAISADGVAGSLGFVTGYADRKSAEIAAVKECKEGGGRECRAEVAFHNQCAAFIIGQNGTTVYTAANEKKAIDLGLAECEDKLGRCKVYKTGCSHAEAVPIR